MDRTSDALTGRGRRWALAAVGVALALTVGVLAQRDDAGRAAEGEAGGGASPTSPAAAPSTETTPTPTREPTAGAPSRRPTRHRVPSAAPRRVRIPDQATERFAVAPGRGPEVGRGAVLRYTVGVERGLPYAPAEVAPVVDATLADPRGWTSTGRYAFQRVLREPDFRVLLASPDTTDELCAPLLTRGRVSCRTGALVVLNARRWAYGIPDYEGDVPRYRQYVVNHEVGHVLGAGHVPCPGSGRRAPVMQQQSYGLDGCRPNAWP